MRYVTATPIAKPANTTIPYSQYLPFDKTISPSSSSILCTPILN